MCEDKFDLENFLPYQLAVAAANVSEAFAKSYRHSHGLNRAEWRIICHLSQSLDPISIRDLEARVHLEKSKISRTVSRMRARGLVSKRPHQQDARLIEISLTKEGKRLFQELVPLAQQFHQRMLAKLPGTNGQDFTNALMALSLAYDQTSSAPESTGQNPHEVN